jgi:Leucine Rich repeat
MEALGRALIQNESSECLILGYNNFSAVGLTSFANALKVNKTLQKLWLGDNSVGDDGAMILSDALMSNTTLTWLNLWGANIGDDGAAALGQALKVNTSLKWLILSKNSIGDAGATLLLSALTECNTTLTALYLHACCRSCSNNNISETISRAIERIVDATNLVFDSFMLPCGQGSTAGPIFLLVRAAALTDSKVIKVTGPSCKGSRSP